MLTGTPLDLTVIPEILQWLGKAIPIAWLLTLAGSLWAVWVRSQTIWSRIAGTTIVLVVLVLLPLLGLNELRQEAALVHAEQDAAQAEFQARYAKAEALFKRRCETAGENFGNTIQNVEGIVWMKWRPEHINLGDQFDMNDPFGRDCGGEDCLKEVLAATEGAQFRSGVRQRNGDQGYKFVEALDTTDGNLYRYHLRLYRLHDRDPKWPPTEIRSEILKEPIVKFTARYGVSWDDVSTREDRENWIAGGSLSVVDLKTNEIIAKRLGYMMDRGLGNTAGFRSPWGLGTHENSCPRKIDEAGRQTMVGFTRRFLFQVLQPAIGGKK